MNKLFIKILIIISVFECLYLFVLPIALQKFFTKDFICQLINDNTNINIDAKEIYFKTNITPSLTIIANNISAKNKNLPLISADYVNIEISFLPLLLKKISPKHLYINNIDLKIIKTDDGKFNFEDLFNNKKSDFSFQLKNVEIKTNGKINSNTKFSTNIKFSLPFSFKDFSKNQVVGNIFFYNINLNEYQPIFQKFIPSIQNIDGFIDFVNLSFAEQNKVNINANFKDIFYNQKNWNNHIFANGKTNINISANLFKNIINIENFKYKAKNIDIQANGNIELHRKRPVLDINVFVNKSRTEDIISILPPNLVPDTMVIDKIKTYGLYGDIEGEANIKGMVPSPDIVGYVKGRNVHILDKSMHKKHTGTVDLTFDKRKLNMNILVNMLNNQNALITGTTYMYREGVNDIHIKTTKNIDFSLAHKIIIPLSKVFYFQLGPLMDMTLYKGKGNIDIDIKNFYTFVDLNGYCNFYDINSTYKGLYGNIKNANGKLNFKGDNIIVNIHKALLENNLFKANGVVKLNDHLNFNLFSNNSNAKDLLKIINNSTLLKDVKKGLVLFENPIGKTDLSINISSDIVPMTFGRNIPLSIDEAFKNMKVDGKIFFNDIQVVYKMLEIPIKKIKGTVNFTETQVNFKDLYASIINSPIKINGKIDKINSKKPVYNVNISANEFDMENFNNSEEISTLPSNVRNILSQFSDYKGLIDFSSDYKNDLFITNAKVNGLYFIHNDTSLPVNFDDFEFNIVNDKLKMENVTLDLANMPVFFNLNIDKIYNNPYVNAYFTTKVKNDFIENYLSDDIKSKITILGDINVSSKITGDKDKIKIEPKITLYPDSDALIYKIKIGDSSDKREFNIDIEKTEDEIKINNADYYKYITTQSNTIYPVLFAYGNGLLKLNEETNSYEPKLIYVKTQKSLPAKILNSFFDKTLFKQGTITCDLKYEENKLNGDLEARNVDIPIFDTIIKNIKLNTDEENIAVRLFGFINDSAVRIKTEFDNNLKQTPHIDNIDIFAEKIELEKLLTSIDNTKKKLNLHNGKGDFSILEIEEGKLHIDLLKIRNYLIEDINSNFSIDENGLFKFSDINGKMGEGSGSGEILYDVKNSDIIAEIDFKNIDANDLTENLLDAQDQLYGSANANFFIKTKGNSYEELIKNLTGFTYFDIQDGRMPKLGSLEYLLRASNILKGGVTGFTINNVLEILNLVKTGYFSSINGSMQFEQGIANNIEIYSQGENLSLYLHGNYDLAKTNADIEVLGKLSNRISTIFGPIGNTSLNTFFKLIPGVSLLTFGEKNFIENVEKIPSFTNGNYESRTFQAIIKGDINSSGYVQSFKWVK